MKFFMGKLWAVRLGTRQPEPRSAVSHWVHLSGGVDGPAFHRAGDSWSHSHCPGSPSHRETQNHPHGYLAGEGVGVGAGRTPTKWFQNAAGIWVWRTLKIL